jgi:dCMP deaminase
MNNWDLKFIELSNHIAEWSKDTSRKVGAVIVDKDHIVISVGYNGFPRGCDDTIDTRYERPDKYLFTEHAERNAMYHAARHGVSLKGCSIYITQFPCADCARGIIQSGIDKIIAPSPDVNHDRWGDHFKASLVMLEEAKVEIVLICQKKELALGLPTKEK